MRGQRRAQNTNAHCDEATRPWHGRFAPIPATAVARIWWPSLSDSGRARACCVDGRTAHLWQKRFGAARRAELSFVVGGSCLEASVSLVGNGEALAMMSGPLDLVDDRNG
jgi:hypothetical protein